jgi:peptidylprolyl isomerase/FKBP-type peptidyl-prolyl cis-trans isomerase FkpA
MNARERGILVGLAILLAAAIVFILLESGSGQAGPGAGPTPSPEGWDLGRLPNLGAPTREFETESGAIVQVLDEGEGEPVKKGQAIDVAYTAYAAKSGARFERGTLRGLVLERGDVIVGWREGLKDIKPYELRRILVPSGLAYGAKGTAKLAPNTDIIFDARRVQLKIVDLKVGTGAEAKVGSKILVHYKGTLEDGTEFDSSYKRNQPIEFTLKRGGLIDGWVKGIPDMKVGGTRKLWIPYHLAYGERGKEGIAPYSDLVFVVELLDVK